MIDKTDVRYRVDFPEHNVIRTASVNGVPADEPFVFKRWTYYHWMQDRINPVNRVLNRRGPGFCQHLKIDKTYQATVLSYTNGPNSVIVTNPDTDFHPWSPTGLNTVPGDVGWANALIDFPKTGRFSDLCFEAWTKLKTQVPTEVELLNFIYELKDFKELGHSLAKAKGISGKHSVQVLTDPLKGKKQKVRKAAKAVNDTFLSYNFMWAPFVGDLIKLTQVADGVAKRMAFLRKTRGKEVTVKFTKPDCYINSDLLAHNTIWENGDWDEYHIMTKYQCDFNVTCKLYQDLEGLDDAWADLRATFAALGINNPAKAVWQALPFSFLVDWVAPFGKWLERAAIQPFKGTWNVYDITTSARERCEIEHRLTSKPGSSVSLSDTLMTRVSIDRYLRLIGLPQTLGAVDFSQLTQQQQKLFLSLVTSKVL